MIVPVLSQDKSLAVVVLEHKAPDVYLNVDSTTTLSLTGQAGLAMENAQLFYEVRMLAITDDLIGLYNRRHFYELGEREFTRAGRYRHPLSVIMIDIDHFKEVNDNFGHYTGDEVLKEIARRCQKVIRKTDIIGRFGGEEFCILLTETDMEGAVKVAENLRQEIAGEPVVYRDQGEINFTASFGVSSFKDTIPNFNGLMEEADRALYEAKQKGRNRVEADA